MKKTLFAMAALALCSTAFARTYDASSSTPDEIDSDDWGSDYDVTLNVNDNRYYGYIYMEQGSLTLNFQGGYALSTDWVDIAGTSLAITGNTTALTYWGNQLTSSANPYASVTLIGTTDEYNDFGSSGVTFMDGAESITLGDITVGYTGYYSSMDSAIAAIGSENAVALVGNDDGLFLVGKISGSPTTPEPATATLSLLALAGLASRRRRK